VRNLFSRTSWARLRILLDSLIMEWRVALFVVTSVAVNPLSAHVAAQGSEKVRLTGAAVVSVHNPGESGSASDIGPAFGGSAPGVVVGLQVPVGSGRRATFEVGLERSIQGNQSTRSALWLTTHRDTTFSGLLAWTKREPARVAPTAVGGLTFALRHTVSNVLEIGVGLVVCASSMDEPLTGCAHTNATSVPFGMQYAALPTFHCADLCLPGRFSSRAPTLKPDTRLLGRCTPRADG